MNKAVRGVMPEMRVLAKAVAMLCACGSAGIALPAMASTTVTTYTYDAGNNVTTVTDPRGLITAYSYDGFGQLWGVSSPDTGTTTSSYDAYGRRSGLTRANGAATTYGYDALNRPTTISAGGQTQTFAYDSCTNGLGRLCTASDSTGSTAYSYTPEGWMAGRGFSIAGTNYSLGYGYDAMGHLATVNYPDGNQAIYSYSNGVVSGITFAIGGTRVTAASSVTWQPMNAALTSWASSNGLANTLSYDMDGRLTAINTPGVESLGFSYDVANRITGIDNALNGVMSQNFDYDDQSRLVSQASTNSTDGVSYDDNGNMIAIVANGAASSITYSTTSNQLVSITGASPQSYGYDALGNITKLGGTTAYQYDAFNRMSAAGGMSYYVNPEGQRLRKAGSAGTTYFAPDANGPLMAENDNGAWIDYLWLGGRLIGREVNGQLEAIGDDQVGRPQVVTNTSQTVVWSARNWSFTRGVALSNSAPLNIGFPGQYYDAETGLWNNGFRDYDPTLGRYVESDPLGLAGGVNTYAYANSDPLTLTDPLGLCDQQKCTAARTFMATLGRQFSSAGSVATWTGVGLVTASGIGGIFAPEAAPLEVVGAENGVGLIEVGGIMSKIGDTATGYASGGFAGAGGAFVRAQLTDLVTAHLARSNTLFHGVSESNATTMSGLFGKMAGALQQEEEACAVQ